MPTNSIFTFERIVAWSDSMVALTWIRSSPHRWKTFVANRITFIQEHISPSCWRHVPSEENPADPASRGLLPSDVMSCSLWWAAPTFLQQAPESWPVDTSNSQSPLDTDLEPKSITLLAQTIPSDILRLLDNFSSLRKVQGILAYIVRFYHNLRNPDKMSGPLCKEELHRELLRLVKLVQATTFPKDISAIRNNKKCSKYLQKLSPFIDTEGILRDGGRLSKSDLSFSVKHSALLPRTNRLTELIVKQIHNQNYHQYHHVLTSTKLLGPFLSSSYSTLLVRLPSMFQNESSSIYSSNGRSTPI